MIQLSKRLQAVANLAGSAKKMADVGTDHGYIPIYMIEQGLAESAIAMDINKGPLLRAEKNIQIHGLSDRITVRLSDGVRKLKEKEADLIIIAGMGGQLTNHILSDGEQVLKSVSKMVLQPQSELFLVRRFLHEHGYRIVKEDMVKDEGKYYPMMLAEHGEQAAWTEEEYAYGRYLIEEKNLCLAEFLEKEETLCGEILGSIAGKNGDHIVKRREEVEQKLMLIRKAKERMA